MSAQSTIAKLRAELEAAQARGVPDADLVNSLVDVAKSVPGGIELLIETHNDLVRKNRTDIGAAIQTALFPSRVDSAAVRVGKSVKADDSLTGAIGAALRRPVKATHDVTKQVLDGTAPTSKLTKKRDADEASRTADLKTRASKVRADIHGPFGGAR
jgi:hypothetical protein